MKRHIHCCWPYLLVFFSAFSELFIANSYFQVSGELLSIVALTTFACLLALMGWMLTKSSDTQVLHYGERVLFTLLFACAFYMLWGRSHNEVELVIVRVPALVIVAGASLLFSVFALVCTPTIWQRIKSSSAVAVAIFVLSQPLLVLLIAPNVSWPAATVLLPSGMADGRNAIIFLLLDEFSASEAGSVLSALAGQPVDVVSKNIESVGNKTADVIPELLSGNNFSKAKPCGMTAICSGTNVLAFERITATRPDIDLVGFYHPYCAIVGLRSCALITRPSPLLDAGRWRCAIRNLEGEFAALKPECKPVPLLPRFEDAIFAAPLWRDGGMMFAHLPLPHPPGEIPGNSLDEEYQHNLARAGQLLVRIVQNAKRAGLSSLKLVVFSDHPLRKDVWCAQQRYKNGLGCEALNAKQDTQVPLIVATFGQPLPDVGKIKTNAQVFELLGN